MESRRISVRSENLDNKIESTYLFLCMNKNGSIRSEQRLPIGLACFSCRAA
jgi:hypothetical protein